MEETSPQSVQGLHTRPVSAPDPTATILDENTPQQSPTTDPTNPKFSLNVLLHKSPKYYLSKIVSVGMIIHGLLNLYEQVYDILVVYPHLPEFFQTNNFSFETYQSVFYRAVIVTATGLINTIYGIALASRHSNVIHYLHIITGFALMAITYYLSTKVPPLDIEAHLPGLAFALQF